MSWFTDLAGKAEDFLVKIDQNAAVAAQALSKDKAPTVNMQSIPPNLSQVDVSVESNKLESTIVSSNLSLKASSSATDLLKVSKQHSKLDRDAELMASLNQNDINVTQSNGEMVLTNGNGISLQQENQLLKQEIRSLSQEIRQAMQCAKQAEKGL
jgi:hypothetical protein